MAEETYDGDIANDIAKWGTYGAFGAAGAGAAGIGGMAARDYMGPASRLERQMAAHEAVKLGQRTAKAKTLGAAINKTGKSGIVRSGGKKYHYNKEGVLTHVEHANGKKVYTKAGAEAQANAAPSRQSKMPRGENPVSNRMTANKPPYTDQRGKPIRGANPADTAMSANKPIPNSQGPNPAPKPRPAETGIKAGPKLEIGPDGKFVEVDPKAAEYKTLKAEADAAAKPVAENVAEAAGRQTAIEAGAKASGRTVLGMANNVAGQSVSSTALKSLGKNTVPDFFKDAWKHSGANSAKLLSFTNAGRIGAGIATNQIHSYLNDGGTWAGNIGTQGMADEMSNAMGSGGTEEDIAARKAYALHAARNFHRVQGETAGEISGAAAELVTGGRTLGGLDVLYQEITGGAANIATSFNGDKSQYTKDNATAFNDTRQSMLNQYLKDEKDYGAEGAKYINGGELSDTHVANALMNQGGYKYTPPKGESILAKHKREQDFLKTKSKVAEFNAIEDDSAINSWIDSNKDFLSSANLDALDPRTRFRFAHRAFGKDTERALGYLNSTGENRQLGVADFIRGQSTAPDAPSAPMAKAPMSPLAQATQSPQYSNPGLFGLNSQSPMGGIQQNQMYGGNLFNVKGMPATDWASNMSREIQNTRIGTKSAMQQGFNNGMWQDSRPMNQRGMGGNSIAQDQTDYMNARGMPSAAQWSAFTNDRQARVKNPELYNQDPPNYRSIENTSPIKLLPPTINDINRGGSRIPSMFDTGIPPNSNLRNNDLSSHYTPEQLNSAGKTGNILGRNPIYSQNNTLDGMFTGAPGQISASNMPNPNKGKPIFHSVNDDYGPLYKGMVDDSGARRAHNQKYGIVEEEDLPNPTHY